MDNTAPAAYVFEGFRLDLARRRLTDPTGNTVPLSGRAYDVLAYLVVNRARVVSKDEIMRAVWPRVVVEENNLNQAIYVLRRALLDSRGTPRFIVTVAGRGYQFIADAHPETSAPPITGPASSAAAVVLAASTAPVDESAAPASAPESFNVKLDMTDAVALAPKGSAEVPLAPRRSRRWLLLAGAAAAGVAGLAWWLRARPPATGIPSKVAVLPFKPLLEPDANAAVEFGITETMINRLGVLPGVVVPPLSSVRRYEGAGVDPLQAGRELGVDAVLDGHIQIDGKRLRLTARLIDTDDGHALWAGQFNEPIDDFFAVQESLADQVVRALAVELSPEQRNRLTRRDTASPEAWQLYLNGRYQTSLRTRDGLLRGLEFFEAAARRDPTFALPQVGIADVLTIQGVFGLRAPLSVFPRARAAAERAIALDDELAEAYAALGHIQVQFDRDWREGERLYRHSLALRPNQAMCTLLLANCLMMQGRSEEALKEGRRAQAIEPADVAYAANLGILLTFSRMYDLAYEQLTGLFDSAPQNPLVRNHLARVLSLRGEPDAAIGLLEGFDAPAPGNFSNLGRAYALAGRTADAHRELDRLRALGAKGFGVGYDAALIHAALGDRESALAGLEDGMTDHSQMILFLNVEPGFDAIRGDPRFRSVSARLGLG